MYAKQGLLKIGSNLTFNNFSESYSLEKVEILLKLGAIEISIGRKEIKASYWLERKSAVAPAVKNSTLGAK